MPVAVLSRLFEEPFLAAMVLPTANAAAGFSRRGRDSIAELVSRSGSSLAAMDSPTPGRA